MKKIRVAIYNGTSFLFSPQFCPQLYRNFTEGEAMWVGEGPAAYIMSAKSDKSEKTDLGECL
jgi:hypothetical protein